jgi:hypothetical protein
MYTDGKVTLSPAPKESGEMAEEVRLWRLNSGETLFSSFAVAFTALLLHPSLSPLSLVYFTLSEKKAKYKE